LHRQDAAMMTCFTPSASRGDYVDSSTAPLRGCASAFADCSSLNPTLTSDLN
jgi:hypothetical protein